ncbi:acid protease [Clavulina sp. PMI_390]|nr:acid protease [Clavulina sp. PMI_390]
MVARSFAAIAASLALLASASPVERREQVVKLPLKKKVTSTSSAREFLAKEAVRVSSFATAASTGTATAVNEDSCYFTTLTIGTQSFSELIVDTGSSNTWVGAGTKYVKSSTGTSTGKSFSVTYGSGTVKGTEYTDTVTFGGLTVVGQSIGVASSSSGFSGTDGIVGFGPVILTEGTVSGTTEVPTLMDNLKSNGAISTEVLGVYFTPVTGSNVEESNGELTIGGVDTAKYTGTLTYFSKSTTSPYSYYWGIDTTSMSYGSTSLSSAASAIVDTGTTLIYIPTSAYNKFLTASGGTTDSTQGIPRFSTAPTGNFTITIGGVAYVMTPSMYLIPTAQLSVWGLSTKYSWSWIANGGSTAADVNFIIGMKFLEHFYSVYDTTNSRIGKQAFHYSPAHKAPH